MTVGGMDIVGFTGSGFSNQQDLSFATVGGIGGIGVFNDGVGGTFLSSVGNEYIAVGLPTKERWFAITLNHFGTYTSGGLNFTERVEFAFLNGLSPVGTVVKSGCRVDGDLASFTIDVPGGIYDIVTIRPIAATEPGGSTSASAMLISDLAACLSTANACQTSLQTAVNHCP
jgi:hypothetical protein